MDTLQGKVASSGKSMQEGEEVLKLQVTCLQAARASEAAGNLELSEEMDGEYRDAAAATRTAQGAPGVMEAQSASARSDPARLAADVAEGAPAEAQEERKWQSFMSEHFGESLCQHTMLLEIRRYCVWCWNGQGYFVLSCLHVHPNQDASVAPVMMGFLQRFMNHFTKYYLRGGLPQRWI